MALALLQFLPVVQAAKCVNSLKELEDAVQSNAYNMESIDDGFFPVNTAPSIAVNVFYIIDETAPNSTTASSYPTNSSSFERHGSALGSGFKFYSNQLQWVSQRVLLPFGPELFELRGLAVFTLTTPKVYVIIPPICRKPNTDAKHRIEKLLVRLTTKVSL